MHPGSCLRKAKFAGGQCKRLRGSKRERRTTKFGRIDTEKQVVHHRVGNEHTLDDVLGIDTGFLRDILE